VTKTRTGPQGGDRLLLGIDLGTSRSVVCASNGARAWLDSYVGYPKDFVARKVIGAPVLFGQEALKIRLSLDLYRPLEHGVIREGSSKNEQAVQDLIRHLISLANPGQGESVCAAVGVPAETFKNNKLAIMRCVGNAVDSLLVVSEPFAVAYGKNLLNDAFIIDIGGGTIDFCIMHGTLPDEEDQRTLLAAGDAIDEKLYQALKERYPKSSITLNMARQFKEAFSFVGEPPGEVKVDIPVEGKTTQHDITSEMRAACESILPAVIETAVEMISKFDPEYQDAIRRNIVLAGGGSQIRGLAQYIDREMQAFGPCGVTQVDDVLHAGAAGCLALAQDMPAEYWEQMGS
jgi:rod shape-determining protein MreB